jgi:hypothetical protein
MKIKTLTSIEELKKAIDIFDDLPEAEKQSTALKILEFAKRNDYIVKKESILKYRKDENIDKKEIEKKQEEDKDSENKSSEDKDIKAGKEQEELKLDNNSDGDNIQDKAEKIELTPEELEAREKMLAKFRHLGLDRAIPRYIKEEDLIYSKAEEPGKHDAYIKWRNKIGKLEYAYTEQFREEKDKLKFERVKKYTDEMLNDFKTDLTNTLKDENSTETEKEVAVILKMLEKTGLRVGDKSHWKSDKYSAEARGISTLQASNINIQDDRIELNFIGKSNVENNCVFFDKEIADYLKDKINKNKDKEFLFSCNKKAVDKKFKSLIKVEDCVVKDLRTIKANDITKTMLYNNYLPPMPLPENESDIKEQVETKLMNIFDNVSFTLNNEPNTTQQWYVDKKHIEEWLNYLNIEPFEIKSAKTKRADDFAPKELTKSIIKEDISNIEVVADVDGENGNDNIENENEVTYSDLKKKTEELLNYFKKFTKEQDIEIDMDDNKTEEEKDFEMFNEDIYPAPEWFNNKNFAFRKKE